EYTDSAGRAWTFNAIMCTEIKADGKQTEWSWVTSLEVSRKTVVDVATKGGRARWREENEGFNTQKNSGLNLEHAYSHTCWAAYYFLLQIAHLLLQLVEKGNLLRHLAQEQGKRTAMELFGSLKNMAQRLLDSLRYRRWPEEVFDRTAARAIQIRLDSSETPGWRVGVFQVRPGGSGSGGGGTRIRLRARPPYGRFHLAMGPRLPFGLPAPRPRSRFLRAGPAARDWTPTRSGVKMSERSRLDFQLRSGQSPPPSRRAISRSLGSSSIPAPSPWPQPPRHPPPFVSPSLGDGLTAPSLPQ